MMFVVRYWPVQSCSVSFIGSVDSTSAVAVPTTPMNATAAQAPVKKRIDPFIG